MAILMSGGAGYIGSHTVAELLAAGEEAVVVDDLSQGHRAAAAGARLYELDIRESGRVRAVIRDHRVDTVIHFAARTLVGESVQQPLEYYDANVVATQRLLAAAAAEGVRRFVFSSSAAVYGEPERVPIPEDHPARPTNPYGETKLAVERMLRWCDAAYGLKSVSLRYFNAAGAHPERAIGEDHHPESHLIPIILQALLGRRGAVSIFGSDYPTPDGTCVRDYVHVMDLAAAHRLAVEYLRAGGGTAAFNLGNGAGFSVRQVIDAVERVTGGRVPVEAGPRRAGDPAVLVASSGRVREALGWQPQYASLDAVVATAWEWHRAHPDGFGDRG